MLTHFKVELVGSIEAGISAMAWSPDQEIAMFVTGHGTLLCMTQDFETLNEQSLFSEGFGEQRPVSVGWGKVETQFRGSAGKMSGPVSEASASLCPSDDKIARISWRGDGQFCATLVAHPSGFRSLRVWGRDGALQSTGEKCDMLHHSMAWRPDGSLIAGVQQNGDRLDLVFFERNGLRHGEFTLPYTARDVVVRELHWSSDSSILMVWADSCSGDSSRVMLWTVGNYHWFATPSLTSMTHRYLKHEIACGNLPGAITTPVVVAAFHPERPVVLLATAAGRLLQGELARDVVCSEGDSAANPSTVYPTPYSHHYIFSLLFFPRSLRRDRPSHHQVAVVDGAVLLLTPFRAMVVPPPMSACRLALSSVPRGVAFIAAEATSPSSPSTPAPPIDGGVLLGNGQFVLFRTAGDTVPTLLNV
jgi:elongator complex protein 1